MNDTAWIQTASGRKVYPLALKHEDVDIFDIAYALSNQTRYLGHASFYSVAEHCCHVSDLLPREHALAGLLHDAAEAYLGDWSRPLKLALAHEKPELAEWLRAVDDRTTRVIFEALGVPWPIPDAVHEVDDAIIAFEANAMHGKLIPDWDVWIGEYANRSWERKSEFMKGSLDAKQAGAIAGLYRFAFLERYWQLAGKERVHRARGDRLNLSRVNT
jgi:hypothetical protein